MDALHRLIGTKVDAIVGYDIEGDEIWQLGMVIDVIINDEYFQEKNEPIYISVNIITSDPLPDGINPEDLIDIPITNIRKA